MQAVIDLPFPKQALVFTCLQYKSFENTVGKGEIACDEQFVHFPQCFLPFWRTLCLFHRIKDRHLQTLSVWMSLKLVVWERVNFHGIDHCKMDYCYCRTIESHPV